MAATNAIELINNLDLDSDSNTGEFQPPETKPDDLVRQLSNYSHLKVKTNSRKNEYEGNEPKTADEGDLVDKMSALKLEDG